MKFTRITVDPRQMGGVPCIRSLRIPVATIVGMVADGMADTEILAASPDLQLHRGVVQSRPSPFWHPLSIPNRLRDTGAQGGPNDLSDKPSTKPGQLHGYVNGAIPEAEFVEFVNAFAERVSRFDLLALADIKRFVNAVSLPADAALTAEADAFAEAVARPTTPSIIKQALERGFQQRSDVELNLGAYVGTVVLKPGHEIRSPAAKDNYASRLRPLDSAGTGERG